MIKVLLVSLLINLPTFFSSQVNIDIAHNTIISIGFFKKIKINLVHFCQYSDTFISCHFINSREAKKCPVVDMLCGDQYSVFTVQSTASDRGY